MVLGAHCIDCVGVAALAEELVVDSKLALDFTGEAAERFLLLILRCLGLQCVQRAGAVGALIVLHKSSIHWCTALRSQAKGGCGNKEKGAEWRHVPGSTRRRLIAQKQERGS
eukprot:TRINITY_DN112560_c0_g1_i1.p2 TRINITY_DN112560_c0_g1~~TRINITY_DN112560_c0_g1_i1.p2  ORF type:complete len:112 (+),score=24.78 TRINITY_DN112560_c0_g1_i1:171-506(+)